MSLPSLGAAMGLLSVIKSFVATIKKLLDSGADAAKVLDRLRAAMTALENASHSRITTDRAIADLDALADLRALRAELDETRAASLADLKKKPKA